MTKKNDDGSTVTVERDKRLRPWYWHDLSGKWFIELRYTNTVLSLAKDLQPLDGHDVVANTDAAKEYCLKHLQWRLGLQMHKILGLR